MDGQPLVGHEINLAVGDGGYSELPSRAWVIATEVSSLLYNSCALLGNSNLLSIVHSAFFFSRNRLPTKK